MEHDGPLTTRRIAAFWWPLAATWLMMAVEGPFLAAIIARVGDPEHNLAAWGVAFAFAIIVEAPIIMLMSASTALAKGRASYRRLRAFMHGANAALTVAMLILLTPPVFDTVMRRWIGLPAPVAELTHTALLIFLPWPGAIGFRRFYQGVLIGGGQTRKVAWGTVVRLVTMAGTALTLRALGGLPGATIGAAAASAGVVAEGIASWVMARGRVRRLLEIEEAPAAVPSLGGIARFYAPLALTSTLALAAQPMVTFFVGHSKLAIESLAVLPVVHGLSFVFRALGLSYQEVVIALAGDRLEHRAPLRRFAVGLGAGASLLLAAIAFTPLAGIWFVDVSGLTAELDRIARLPIRIVALFPALTVLLAWQRAILVTVGRTAPITWATVVEVAVIGLALFIGIDLLSWVGATAATAALVVGRLAGNALLVPVVGRAGAGQPASARNEASSDA